MDVKELEQKLEKISIGCDNCKAKMCNICPNGQLKTSIRRKIKELSPNSQRDISLFKRFLKKLGLMTK